jgi:hypothetical protein
LLHGLFYDFFDKNVRFTAQNETGTGQLGRCVGVQCYQERRVGPLGMLVPCFTKIGHLVSIIFMYVIELGLDG